MLEAVVNGIFSAAFLATILRVTTPILLPSMGALISGRAGVTNIGLEGLMLSSAFTGVIISAYSQQWFGLETGQAIGPWLGLVCGVAVSILLALLLAVFHLRFKADLTLASLAINILGSAGTVAIMFELTGDRGNTSTLASLQVPFIQLPEFIRDIPVIGTPFFDIFDNQNVMTWVAFISVVLVWFMLYRTPFGFHLRATGENPAAAESVGIPVQRMRYYALLLSGLFAGLGGIHMSMGYLSLFQRDMTAGRGFIALAAPLLGGGNPYGTMAASLVFGTFSALENRVASLQIPSQLPQMIPFVATVLALLIYALQTRQSQLIRALRAAQTGYAPGYWGALQRVSVLHVLLMTLAVIGILIAASMFAAPKGFGGDASFPVAVGIALASVAIIGINLPFIAKVDTIRQRVWLSAAAAAITLGLYLTLFLLLFQPLLIALVGGLLLAAAVWVLLGGVSLARATPAPA
jgi:simple sugar transport system permease protein